MIGTIKNDICPNCGGTKGKNWDELADDERTVAIARLGETPFAPEKMKKHRVCSRCFRVIASDNETLA